MALDAAMLQVAALELRERLVGARVEKIHMPARDEVLFLLRTPTGHERLFVSARSGAARIHLTGEPTDNPATPPGFCMLLRKHLSGGRIAAVRDIPGERIVLIDFEVLNEMGDRVTVTMSVELMGRYSNIVLVTQDGIVLDAMKRIDDDISELRQLLPGRVFTMPPVQDKLLFPVCTNDEILARIARASKPLSAALLVAVGGISPLVCREIAARTDGGDPDADTLTAAQKARLEAALDAVRAAMAGSGRVLSIVYDGDKPVEYSFIVLTQYRGLRAQEFETCGALLDCYYAEKDRAERARTRSSNLMRQVSVLLERANRKQRARLDERDNAQLSEQKKLYGELLSANLHTFQKGAKTVRVQNYYTGEDIEIPLDVTKTPVQNSQKYFREYRKLTTAANMLSKLLEQGAQEIAYLESVLYEITEARTEEDFDLIRRELADAGYLRGVKVKPQKNTRKTKDVLEYRTTDGFLVLVGRNNLANDRLTLRTADRRDLWFHVKDAQGSHVILVGGGQPVSDSAKTAAAMLAALHSTQAAGSKVPVDYTAVKHVRKAPGQRAGMVIYESYETAYVTPDLVAIKKMRENKEGES